MEGNSSSDPNYRRNRRPYNNFNGYQNPNYNNFSGHQNPNYNNFSGHQNPNYNNSNYYYNQSMNYSDHQSSPQSFGSHPQQSQPLVNNRPYDRQYDNYYNYNSSQNNERRHQNSFSNPNNRQFNRKANNYYRNSNQSESKSEPNHSHEVPQYSANGALNGAINGAIASTSNSLSYRKANNYYRNSNKSEFKSEPNHSYEVPQHSANGAPNVAINGAIASTSTSLSNNGINSINTNNRRREESEHKKLLNSDNRGSHRAYGERHQNRDYLSEKNAKYEVRKDKDKDQVSHWSRSKPKTTKHFESDESQREIMEELLRKGELECMVCCEDIRIRDAVWHCELCYNIFHLKCIKTWANSESSQVSQSEAHNNNWRCPACQSSHKRMPSRYQCFCGKVREPELNRYLVPHSCGEMCGRKRKTSHQRKHECPHKCLLLCHPGPCPPCQAKVTRECACGQTKVSVSCATNDDELICKSVCNKLLNCGEHCCQSVCHSGKCDECQIMKTQSCFCGKNKREVQCRAETAFVEMYSCEGKCEKTLACGQHKCESICHEEQCNGCALDPNFVTHCPCDKTELIALTKVRRKTCTDPIPTCHQICDKELVCGPEKDRHKCKKVCHSGGCPPCDQKTVIRCRCGANSENIDCLQLSKEEDRPTNTSTNRSTNTPTNTPTNRPTNWFICKKRCNKKRQCGRHKCLNECCTDEEHPCEQICGKKLSCGSHTCEELCHNGNCPKCWNISWDELCCRCGNEVKLPPIECGSKRPECKRICSRRHQCEHPIDHNCHDDDECPPCTYLVSKLCYGGHEQRTVPCYQNGVSCGFSCLKPLSCGLHECQMTCHSADCGECTLPCNKVRDDCEHICGLKCHQKQSLECPKSACKVLMKVSCDCGRKTDQMPCFKVNDENSLRLSMNALANIRIKNGESVNISELIQNSKELKLFQLKCDDKCAVLERNRQLAEALDIKDADFSPDPGPPKYSDMLKNAARCDPAFVSDIYEKLRQLVMDSKQSKLSFKNFNFPPMNSENRHIVHELAEFFGCKTHAIDREPNRSVIAKAAKDKCYLPTVNLMDIIKDETEPRKAVANKYNKITLKSYSFDQQNDENNFNLKSINQSSGSSITRKVAEPKDSVNKTQQNTKVIDYFDFNGE